MSGLSEVDIAINHIKKGQFAYDTIAWRKYWEVIETEFAQLRSDLKAAKEAEEVATGFYGDARKENEALKKMMRHIVENPHWLSIGSINNTAEIRITKRTHDEAMELCHD